MTYTYITIFGFSAKQMRNAGAVRWRAAMHPVTAVGGWLQAQADSNKIFHIYELL